LAIPKGFAHGFQALDKDCELVYLHSAPYWPEAEAALNACDPSLAIDWPLPIAEISDRDRSYAMLSINFKGVVL
jgi:dTDP-4-dehydrorhamnose 3,5-epimerase